MLFLITFISTWAKKAETFLKPSNPKFGLLCVKLDKPNVNVREFQCWNKTQGYKGSLIWSFIICFWQWKHMYDVISVFIEFDAQHVWTNLCNFVCFVLFCCYFFFRKNINPLKQLDCVASFASQGDWRGIYDVIVLRNKSLTQPETNEASFYNHIIIILLSLLFMAIL